MTKVLYRGFMKLLTTLRKATGRPPAFSLLADKATLHRRTGQMAGIMTIMNGKLKAICLSTLLALESTGEGFAKLLIEVLGDGKPLKLSVCMLPAPP